MAGVKGRSGRHQGYVQSVVEALEDNKQHTSEYLKALRSIGLSRTNRPADRVSSLTYLLNRAHGVPASTLQLAVTGTIKFGADDYALAVMAASRQDALIAEYKVLPLESRDKPQIESALDIEADSPPDTLEDSLPPPAIGEAMPAPNPKARQARVAKGQGAHKSEDDMYGDDTAIPE